jgi:very-short-patch-repair endonuclease
VAVLEQLYERGLVRQTARRRIKRGAWQEPFPGVVCRTTGTLSPRQRLVAAGAYGGDGAAVSHGSAGAFWGFGSPPASVHITVPHGRHRLSTLDVVVHQSRRPFRPVLVEELHVTPPARTAMDMSLAMSSFDAVTSLLGRAIQRDRVSIATLSEELDAAPRRGSMWPRRVMADLTAGSRAASESRLLQLMRRAGLPLPELNAAVSTRLGTRYVDALWRDLGKGVEVDGQAFHLDPAAWRSDLIRQNAIQSTGIVLLRIAAHRLWTEPEAVIAEITAFLGLSAN